MKKILKITGILLAVILSIIVALAAWVNFSGTPVYENKAPKDFPIIADSINIAEGARMASMLCTMCHLSESGKLDGKIMEEGNEFGTIYSPNITQHPTYGIASYTNGELAYLLRTGIKRTGEYAPPWMSKFPHLSDIDLNNLIAFLRSDHPMVQPSDKPSPPQSPSFLSKALIKFAFKPLPYPDHPIPPPNKNDKPSFGKYIATAKFECYSCHSIDFTKQDPMEPENSKLYFGGGNPMPNQEGEIILTPNLTMDKETGLGNWTEEEFIRCVKYGIRPNGRPATAAPMIPFTKMTDEEASAIWAYLQTVPIIKNEALLKKP